MSIMQSHRQQGFTLIELMIVVVVIGILAAVGYPTYMNYITESRRSEAHIALATVASTEEKFLTSCSNYTDQFGGDISHPVVANRCTGLKMGAGATYTSTPAGYYSLVVTLNDVPGVIPSYTITATPIGPQTRDAARCTTISLNSIGMKTATGSDSDGGMGGRCWKKKK